MRSMIKDSIYDSQEEREKALLVLINTVTFIEKLINERKSVEQKEIKLRSKELRK